MIKVVNPEAPLLLRQVLARHVGEGLDQTLRLPRPPLWRALSQAALLAGPQLTVVLGMMNQPKSPALVIAQT